MQGMVTHREVLKCSASSVLIHKANYRHFMVKEIHEQPEVVGHTLARYVEVAAQRVALPQKLPFDFHDLGRILITGCGTASYAGHVAKYWFERLARVPVEVDVASEFRYREPPLRERDLAILISQSGETADTLAALRCAKSQGLHTLSVVNVPTSTIARESETVLQTLAGPAIGVPSTKAFSCQLTVLAALAITAGRSRGELSRADEARLVQELVEVPRLIAAALATEPQIENLAREIAKSRGALCIGRGSSFPLALEGALKLKEIAYVHAEGYAAGELKHGPLALVVHGMPVVVIAPRDLLFDKVVSNKQEAAARGGNIILITDAKGAEAAAVDLLATVVLPDMATNFTPIVYDIPMQLLAYHTGLMMGTDADQPRNLAKSSTVE
ncbi:glucosamine--fructose-6-phosphate aminotransferase (isomerizing) [Bradyrhizobium sp. JR1.5]